MPAILSAASRFTIRDLLWLTVVVALGIGWWLDRSRLSWLVEERTNLAESFRKELKHSYSRSEGQRLEVENAALRLEIEEFKKALLGDK